MGESSFEGRCGNSRLVLQTGRGLTLSKSEFSTDHLSSSNGANVEMIPEDQVCGGAHSNYPNPRKVSPLSGAVSSCSRSAPDFLIETKLMDIKTEVITKAQKLSLKPDDFVVFTISPKVPIESLIRMRDTFRKLYKNKVLMIEGDVRISILPPEQDIAFRNVQQFPEKTYEN